MRKLVNAFSAVQRVIQFITGAALAGMMFVILAQTFSRYVVFHSIPWSEELSRYLFVMLVMLASNIGITHNSLVNIDIIDALLNKAAKKAFAVGRVLIGLGVNLFFFCSTFGMISIGKFQKSPALELPMSYLYIIVSIGFFLSAVACLLRTASIIMQKEGE